VSPNSGQKTENLRITLCLEYQKIMGESSAIKRNHFSASVREANILVKKTRLLVSLHDRVGYEGDCDLVPSKPATIQTLYSFLGRFN